MTTLPWRYDPAHTALVVVDVQNDFVDPSGSLAGIGIDVSAAVAMVPTLDAFMHTARTRGIPIIIVQTTHDETTDSRPWLDRTLVGARVAPTEIICRTGTWGAELYGIEVSDGDIVVTKHRFSAFVGTNLDVILRTLGMKSLLLAGVATEVCVESTLRDGLSRDYYVTMVEDCCASYSQSAHDASLQVVRRNFGTVMTSARLTALW